MQQSFLDELIYRSDIVDIASQYVRLKKTGSNHVGLCPFHNEKTPSFSVSAEKQFFKCFGCGEGGNVITFVMKIENLPYIEAVRWLAARANMEVPDDNRGSEDLRAMRERILELNRQSAKYFHENLLSERGQLAREYLTRRGIGARAIKMFGLGYAEDSWDAYVLAMREKGFTNAELESARLASRRESGGLYSFFRDRLIFPISDLRRNVVAFGGRVLQGDGGGRKYINSPDTPVYNKSRVLYGMNLAKNSKERRFILCEGNMDVIALHQAGFTSTVASCGTAFTSEQAKLLGRYASEVVICFDADAAGQNATKKAIDILKAAEIAAKVIKIPPKRGPDGHILYDDSGRPMKNDPDDFIRENGKLAFEALLDQSEDDGKYRLGEIRAKYDLSLDSARAEYAKEAVAYISRLSSEVEREILAANAAQDARLSTDSLLAEIKRARAQLAKGAKRELNRQAVNPQRTHQPDDRALRYKNPASAMCEERLVAAAMDSPELLEICAQKISPDDFSSDFLAKIYKNMLERCEAKLDLSPAVCMSELNDSESAHLALILSKLPKNRDGKEQIGQYIDKIILENKKSTGSDNEALLLAAQLKRANTNHK